MLIVLGSSICMFTLLSIPRSKRDRLLVVLFYALFVFLFAIRGEMGTDWVGYKYYYEHVNNAHTVKEYSFEFGYYFLNKVFSGICGYWTFVFILSVVISAIFYFATKHQTKNVAIAALIGLVLFFYPCIEAIRQMVAVALFFYSLRFIDDKRFSRVLLYFAFNAVGLLFHRTAILCLLYFFFHRFKPVKYVTVVIMLAFPYFQGLLTDLIARVPWLDMKFSFYFGKSTKLEISEIFSLKNLEYLLLTIYFIAAKKKSKKEQNITDMLILGCLLLLILGSFLDATYRLAYYTDIGVILAYCAIYDRIKSKDMRIVYCLLLGLYVVIRFYRLISLNPELFGIGA